MNHTVHNKLVSFIWGIADDCLRDVYVRGKYRDVILPMVVLRRLDTLLEPTKASLNSYAPTGLQPDNASTLTITLLLTEYDIVLIFYLFDIDETKFISR